MKVFNQAVLIELKRLASLTVVGFVFLAIPITIFLSLNSEQTSRRQVAATPRPGYQENVVTSDLDGPVAMALAPVGDNRIFVTEQCYGVRVIKDGVLLSTPFVNLQGKINCSGERGVLGITLDPNFASNKFVYVYYTASSPQIHNRVVRFTANGDVAASGSETTLLDLDNLSSASNHNGGALGFGKDGKLYVASGENANPAHAQNLGNLHGKILRINPTGGAPSDNPFVGQSGRRAEIWAYGFRNPFTFAVDSVSGRIYVNDVGQDNIEEISELTKGGNFGWPSCEGNQNYQGSCSGFVAPFYTYNHSVGKAITGGDFYNADTFPGKKGHYFFADYVNGWIKEIDPVTKSVSDFISNANGPVDIKASSDGKLYYIGHNGNNAGIYSVSYGLNSIKPGSTALWCETEGATLTSPMVKGTESGASAGAYIYSTVNDVSSTPPPPGTGSAALTVNIPKAGTYNFWARVRYTNGETNSFYVKINNSSYFKVGNEDNFGDWHWVNIQNGDTSPAAIRYNFTTTGAFPLTISGRESNTKIDKIFLTDDLAYIPDDANFPGSVACSTNKPPVATITSPVSTLKYNFDQVVSFSGSATDSEDGSLAASRLKWRIESRHNNDHNHPAASIDGVTSGSFKTNNFGGAEPFANTFYVVTLIAEDSAGQKASTSVNIMPNTSRITLSSNPSGLQLKLSNGALTDAPQLMLQTAPFSFDTVVGSPLVIEALTPQTLSQSRYNFQSWSDSGAISHQIIAGSSNATFTANFQREVDGTAPTVSITAPTNGETISGTKAINATATDNTGGVGVAKVEFYQDKSQTPICTDTTSPYSCDWNTTTVVNGAYRLLAIASDSNNNAAASNSISVTVQNGDTQKPTTPTLTGTVSNQMVNLSWNGATDNVTVVGYFLIRDDTTIANTALSSAQDSPSCGVDHRYFVVAYDAAGNNSAASNTVTLKTVCAGDGERPTTPGSLTATAVSSSQVNLGWRPSTDNVRVTGYEIYRRKASENNFSLVGKLRAPFTSYGDGFQLSPATVYVYYIRAFDASGNFSDASNTSTATTFAQRLFTGSWFNSTNFTSEVLPKSNDPILNFTWSGSPRNGVRADNFSTRWSGTFDFAAGLYRFNATVDDGVRVYIDNETTPIIDSWKDQGPTTYNALKFMTNGRHTVRVDYYEKINSAVLKMNWVHAETCQDMTGDGLVDRNDLDVAAKHFGQRGTNLPWDIYNPNYGKADGVVNSLDMLLIAIQQGKTCR